MILSLTDKPDCPHCATYDDVRDIDCYGCCIRRAARMMPSPRRALYREIKKEHAAEVYDKFVADVDDYTHARIEKGLMP